MKVSYNLHAYPPSLHYKARSRSGPVASRLAAAAVGRSGHLKQAEVFARKSGGYVRVKILLEGKLRKKSIVLCAFFSKFMLLNFMGTDGLFQGNCMKRNHISFSNIRISLPILVSFESTNRGYINLLNAFLPVSVA